MAGLKSLVKDTAVYGLSSMVGRFLNWLLTYVYVRVLSQGEMGQMTNLYAWVAVLLVLITFGMETTFFRFINKSDKPREVYGTALGFVALNALVFLGGAIYFAQDIALLLGYNTAEALGTATYTLKILSFIIALDAVASIPLAYLRYAQRPWRFMFVKMSFVAFTIVATLGLFYILPKLSPSIAEGLGLESSNALVIIFGINLLGAILQLLMLCPTLRYARLRLDTYLLKEMLRYASPILLLGLVGAFNNQIDKILFPLLYEDPTIGKAQLGIYSACYKIAVIMVLFTQAFRYAYDPFVFAKVKEGETAAKAAYAQSMKYYIYFTLFIFLGVVSTLDVLKFFVTPDYYTGLPAVPIIMLGQLMFGVYFNLSVWYKVTDHTHWGAILSIIGTVVLVLWIVLGVKSLGFMACAWGLLCSNALVMLISYWLGQRYYPINYPLRRIAFFTLLALSIWGVEWAWDQLYTGDKLLIQVGTKLALYAIFVGALAYKELPWAELKQRLPKSSKR